MRLWISIFALLILAACSTVTQPPRMVSEPGSAWRDIASDKDKKRLRDWRNAFVEALADARRAGHGSDITREGRLLEPDASLGGAIPNGNYACRVIKLGAKSEGLLDYISYPAFRCRVTAAGSLQKFEKLTGSQRQVGLLFPGDPMRLVFLGSLALGDEQGAMQYGQDEMRNVAGFLERVGPARWRLILPRPHYESKMDVLELRPE